MAWNMRIDAAIRDAQAADFRHRAELRWMADNATTADDDGDGWTKVDEDDFILLLPTRPAAA